MKHLQSVNMIKQQTVQCVGGKAMFVLISIKNGINNEDGGGTSIVISPRHRPY